MSDEAFFAFLDACRNELAAKQQAFNERLEPNAEWTYDLDAASLTIGRHDFPITAIGTHSSEYQTWLWAWANDTFPATTREGSVAIKSLYDLTGFKVFYDPGINASSADAQDFSACAIHQLDGIGLFRAPCDDATLYLAVHES